MGGGAGGGFAEYLIALSSEWLGLRAFKTEREMVLRLERGCRG